MLTEIQYISDYDDGLSFAAWKKKKKEKKKYTHRQTEA